MRTVSVLCCILLLVVSCNPGGDSDEIINADGYTFSSPDALTRFLEESGISLFSSNTGFNFGDDIKCTAASVTFDSEHVQELRSLNCNYDDDDGLVLSVASYADLGNGLIMLVAIVHFNQGNLREGNFKGGNGIIYIINSDDTILESYISDNTSSRIKNLGSGYVAEFTDRFFNEDGFSLTVNARLVCCN